LRFGTEQGLGKLRPCFCDATACVIGVENAQSVVTAAATYWANNDIRPLDRCRASSLWRAAPPYWPGWLLKLPSGLFHATSAARLTARPDLSERAFFLTVPFQATVKPLSVERPVDAGATQIRDR
jgi:hypothetical protein